MHKYQSHKVVEAAKIKSIDLGDEGCPPTLTFEDGTTQELDVDEYDRMNSMAFKSDDVHMEGGWFIQYPDGYTSWSPAKAFEEGYDLLQPSRGKSNIKGYRELDGETISNINAVKEHGNRVGDFIEVMAEIEGVDMRWLNIGKTHLQQGFMALVRAIAKPEFF